MTFYLEAAFHEKERESNRRIKRHSNQITIESGKGNGRAELQSYFVMRIQRFREAELFAAFIINGRNRHK